MEDKQSIVKTLGEIAGTAGRTLVYLVAFGLIAETGFKEISRRNLYIEEPNKPSIVSKYELLKNKLECNASEIYQNPSLKNTFESNYKELNDLISDSNSLETIAIYEADRKNWGKNEELRQKRANNQAGIFGITCGAGLIGVYLLEMRRFDKNRRKTE